MRLPFLLALALLVGACASCPGRVKEHLALATRDTHDALKFGDYDVVARYLPFDQRATFMSRAFGVEKKLSILDFDLISSEIAPDGKRAIVMTRISWYELPSTIVHTDSVFFDWRRDGEGLAPDGSWTLVRIEGGPLPLEPDAAAPR